MYIDNQLVIRPIKKDLFNIWEPVFKDEVPEWKKWDAPYYPHSSMTYEEFTKESDSWINQDKSWLAEVDGNVTRKVSYY